VAFTMGKCEGAKTIYEIYESVFGEERVPPKQSNIAAQFDTPDAINGAARNIAKVLYG